MRNAALVAFLGLITLPAHAKTAPRINLGSPISSRGPAQRQRMMRAGYAKTARLARENHEAKQAIGDGRGYQPDTLHGLAEALKVANHGEYGRGHDYETVEQTRVPTGVSNWLGRPKTRTDRSYTIKASVLEQVKQTTAKHPDLAAEGVRIAEEFGSPRPTSQIQALHEQLAALVKRGAGESGPLTAQRARVAHAEEVLVETLDTRFAKNLPRFLEALQNKPPEALADYALDLIHKVNIGATTKTIRKELVAQGQAQGQSSHEGQLWGPMGGNRGSSSGSSSFSSSFSGKQLVLDGSDYTVVIKRATSGSQRLRDTTAVGIVEARQIAEMAVEVALITRVLERRAPELAVPLSGWLNHSRIEFADGNNAAGVELSRADADVSEKLGPLGIVSAKFTSALEKREAQVLGGQLDKHGLLDE